MCLTCLAYVPFSLLSRLRVKGAVKTKKSTKNCHIANHLPMGLRMTLDHFLLFLVFFGKYKGQRALCLTCLAYVAFSLLSRLRVKGAVKTKKSTKNGHIANHLPMGLRMTLAHFLLFLVFFGKYKGQRAKNSKK